MKYIFFDCTTVIFFSVLNRGDLTVKYDTVASGPTPHFSRLTLLQHTTPHCAAPHCTEFLPIIPSLTCHVTLTLTLIQVPKHCSVLNRFGMFSENSGSLRLRCNVMVTDARTAVMKQKPPVAELESNVRYARTYAIWLAGCLSVCLFVCLIFSQSVRVCVCVSVSYLLHKSP